jgi:hypothetical protein
MRRYLIVANQTLLGEPLLAKVRECIAAGPCEFHLVVPATHAPGRASQLEGRDHEYAAASLRDGLERFRALGVQVDGEVGDARAMDAVRDALRTAGPFHEIILSTLPAGASRWLHQDLPHRLHRWFELPVSTVIARRVAA